MYDVISKTTGINSLKIKKIAVHKDPRLGHENFLVTFSNPVKPQGLHKRVNVSMYTCSNIVTCVQYLISNKIGKCKYTVMSTNFYIISFRDLDNS